MLRNLLIVLVVCSTLPLFGREFPLCIYGITNPDDIKIIKEAGFSCFQTYKKEGKILLSLAKETQKQKMKVVFRPDGIIGTEYEQTAKKWPILAWYLVDEPDVHHWSRERVLEAHQKAKKAFPQHATTLVIGQGKTAIPYYDLPDIMMVDWYPVPHLPLTSFGDHVRYTKEGLAKTNMQDHALWGVVQIFDWKNYEQYRSDNERIGRFPTEEEIRFMAYDGIFNGATGLFFYTFNHQGKPLPQIKPEYWTRVKAVVQELSKMRPVLENGKLISNPVEIESPLHMLTYKYKWHKYSILINPSQQAQRVPKQLMHHKYKAQFGRSKEDLIPPYTVWVLKY